MSDSNPTATDYSIEDLLTLMARLREPDYGCPWDLAQDYKSIAPSTLEEVYEVIDAIPQNGAIMHENGVLTAFNSDDAEMARRLNQEAAKAVKYGGVSQEDALKIP